MKKLIFSYISIFMMIVLTLGFAFSNLVEAIFDKENETSSNKTSVKAQVASEDSVEMTEDKTDSSDESIKVGTIFENAKYVSIVRFKELVDSGEVVKIGLKDKNTLYLLMQDGNLYEHHDNYGEARDYLKLKKIEPIKLSFKSRETISDISKIILVISASLILGLMVTAYKSVTSDKKKKDKKGKNKSLVTTLSNSFDKMRDTDEDYEIDSCEVPKVRFSDVEGIEELKSDLHRLVDCLKNPEKYDEIGARVPKGVILYGPPGTGKTLLAKAIAGEADVPFYSAVGSDFVEMYVGVGAKRVRELYRKARQDAPCIVFIDEIDAVASQRGKDDNSERDQTINALLAELDGFDSNAQDKVITICATNRLDMLDSAFKRAGRFDLKLAVGLPDKEGRYNILRIHSANKKLAEDVDLHKLSEKCVGFSGAELETLLNEAAMVAVENNHLFINNDDIETSFFKILLQGNRKPRKEINDMNRLIAWHEAGHTLATKLLTEDGVGSVTIIGSSSGAGGVTFRTPKDEFLHSKKYIKSTIGIMYAGRAAEEIYLGSSDLITTGASEDIKQATAAIRDYIGLYGMGDFGLIDISQLSTDYDNIVDEATKMSKEIYNKTLDLLCSHKNTLKNLADNLLEKETLYEDEIDAIIGEDRQ